MPNWLRKILNAIGLGISSPPRRKEPVWKYTEETLPDLGKVDAVYMDGKLLWYDYLKHGVILEINHRIPQGHNPGIAVAKSMTQADIDRHLELAIQSVPADEIKIWGFDRGKWEMEKIIINDSENMVLELGNSLDRDHCCRVIMENGKYDFETVDG